MRTRKPKSPLAVKISSIVAERMRNYCAARGIKQGFFVEKALLEQLEREKLAEDFLDLRKGKNREADSISFEEYLRKKHVRPE